MENLFQYYLLNVIVNVNFFSDLKLKYYCEYYPMLLQNALNKKLKFMGGSMKYFPKKLMGHEIFRSMVSCTTKIFFEKFVKPSVPQPPPTYLTYGPLRKETFFRVTNFCITLSL